MTEYDYKVMLDVISLKEQLRVQTELISKLEKEVNDLRESTISIESLKNSVNVYNDDKPAVYFKDEAMQEFVELLGDKDE